MNIAVLGGGFSGLSAAYYLLKNGHTVTLFEKEPVLGGLASGFRGNGWDWDLERVYHHIFSNDDAILEFAHATGFDEVFFSSPKTASLYETEKHNLITYPLDSPSDLLRFPRLSSVEKIRAGAILAILKYGPHISQYDVWQAQSFLRQAMGPHAADELFGEIFRKKFGNYAEKIVAAFMWARIKKRTKQLGYMEGGFQSFISHIEEKINSMGGIIYTNTAVSRVEKRNNTFTILLSGEISHTKIFDAVIATLPTPIISHVCAPLLSSETRSRWKNITYLHAVNLVIEAEKPLLDAIYWLNICVPKMPMMVAVQHTNFISQSHYNGHTILYIGNYVDNNNPLLSMDADGVLHFFAPYLERINSGYTKTIIQKYLFKASYAQPIFDGDFIYHKPGMRTKTPGFYIANLDMTYPYDRGTNYAVALGKQVANSIGLVKQHNA